MALGIANAVFPLPVLLVGGLTVDPGACVAIEDSANGIRSAHAAKMAVIAIPNRDFPPEPDALALAAVVLDSLEQLDPERVRALAIA